MERQGSTGGAGAAGSLLRPMSWGEILDGAFALYRRHFVTLFATVGLLQLVVLPLGVAVPMLQGQPLLWLSLNLTLMLLALVVQAVATGASICLVSSAALGRELRPGESVRIALRSSPVLILSRIAFTVCAALLCCLAVVPGILLMIVWFAWAQVIVLERDWNWPRRSLELARGAWGKILAVELVALVLKSIPVGVLGAGYVLAGVAQEGGLEEFLEQFRNPKPQPPMELLPALATAASQALAAALVEPFSAAVTTLLYYDQRVRKEGLDVELAAAALDGPAEPA